MTAAIFDPPIDPFPAARLSAVPRATAGPLPVSAEVYRRRRLAVLAVAVGLLLGLASFGRQADATPSAEARAVDAIVVVVQPDDTLWGIAESLAPDADPRPLVSELADLAGSGSLQPGQQLIIPLELLD